MKISVIIPTYKPQDYIWECLDSLSRQSFPKDEYEVIIVLNGCKEPYYSLISEYISRHPELVWKYVQVDAGGVSNARNIALDMASGDFVAFIDDDDYISDCYLSELYEKAGKGTVSLSYPYAFDDGAPDIQKKYSITEAYDQYSGKGTVKASSIRKFFSGPCMKLIPMDSIGDRRFDRRFRNGEDSLFMFLISDRIELCTVASRNAVYYRRYRVNSAVTSSKSFKDVLTNSWKMIAEYTKIYFSSPSGYSLRRYVTSVLGALHTVVVHLR